MLLSSLMPMPFLRRYDIIYFYADAIIAADFRFAAALLLPLFRRYFFSMLYFSMPCRCFCRFRAADDAFFRADADYAFH